MCRDCEPLAKRRKERAMIKIRGNEARRDEIAGLLAELDELDAKHGPDADRDDMRALLRACLRMRGEL